MPRYNWESVRGGMMFYENESKTVVKLAMTIGAATWPIKKKLEEKTYVAVMKMFRWITGIAKKDKMLICERNDEGYTNIQEGPREKASVVWTCNEKTGGLC